ncbi:hypothetical protein AC622_04020 [Bacillus sp. FJAT-27916]|uniref:SpaA isopeptide-forming pilin-related protein n=1 Tax=Bacillus sp. FJAT-27916 TaxID=1679169 RepID=UPI000670ACE3|nr:SpaA isopeptide-forming pilin-related protein [Bacillus sp. FJAT-27916]KMY43500.1 hypothetical protein AC622_04020 [Bacillus sp. FJAT-27916]
MKKFLIYSIILSFFISWLPISTKQATAASLADLGVAKDFNIFVFNNHTHQSSDSEGRVAVGNEAKYSNYSIGSSNQLVESKDRYDLIVGKKLSATGGSNFKGNTAIGTDGVVVEYTMTNNNRVEGNPFKEDVIDFNSVYNDLKYKSQKWSQLTSNGEVEKVNTTLTLTGHDNDLNIFELTTEQLSYGELWGLNLVVPESSTVLINVKGSSLKMGDYSIFLNGQTAPSSAGSRILWNFTELQELQLQGFSMIGAILAPDATFTPSGSGQINGNLIVKDFINSMNGGFELHNYLFNAKLPLEDTQTNFGSIEITKIDADTKEKLAGAEFTLSQDGKVIKTGTTNEKGILKFEDLPFGTYELKETKAPEGYEANGEVKTITIGEGENQHIQITFEDKAVTPEVKTGSIEITKIDKDTKEKLAGAEFTLLQDGKVIKTGTTNEKGILKFEDLPFGTYELKETKAPEGYETNNEVKSITIGEGESQLIQITFEDKAVTPKPEVKTGSIEITKIDKDTQEKLAGAEFTLSQNGKVIKTGVTDENGIVKFEDLPFGTYELKETKAPEGYEANNEVKTITIGEGENQHIQITFEDKAVTPTPEEKTGSIEITKIDKDTQEKLAGAEFTLSQDGKVIKTGVTDENGIVKFDDLPFGTYELKETKAPEGYEANNEVKTITIGEGENQHIQITFEDKAVTPTPEEKTGSIEITKIDKDTQEKLAGAEFTLSQDGKVIKTGTTNEKGVVKFEDLPFGTYELKETKAPEGYETNGEVKTITIGEGENQHIQITFEDKAVTPEPEEKTGSIEITKIDKDTQEKLAGAEFTLSQDGKVIKTGVTDENGIVKFDDLPFGTYELKETKAPEGYVLLKQNKEVTINDDNLYVELTFENKKSMVSEETTDSSEDKTDSSESTTESSGGKPDSSSSQSGDSTVIKSDTNNVSSFYEKITGNPKTGDVSYRILTAFGIMIMAAVGILLMRRFKMKG